MPRLTKDSDSDVEPKTGRRTRALFAQTVTDSPVRRSSRLKQSTKQGKPSPDSGSDTSSVSSSQPTRATRQQTGTMDSTETARSRRTSVRKISVSSDVSEDIDVGTPRRTTRSSATLTFVGTPTKANTRAANKLRAGSESKSPPTAVRTTRRTRASSVDPEIMYNESRSEPSTPIKIRKRASVLPSNSPVKEEEEKNYDPYVKLDAALIEIDEPTGLEFCARNSDSSADKISPQQSQEISEKRESISEDKVEEDSSHGEQDSSHDKIESPSILSSNETSQLLENKNETHSKHATTKAVDKKRSFVEEQANLVENLFDADITITDETSTSVHDTNSQKRRKGNTLEVSESEESLMEVQQSLIEICKKSPLKELGIRIERLTNISTEEQKRNPSNKENQTLNIINDTSAEKNVGSIVSNITLSTKSPISAFANKSLNEKEIKSAKSESSLDKCHHSWESAEDTVEPCSVSKENTDIIKENMDTSTDSLISHKKTNVVKPSPSIDNTNKRRSSVHDVSNESSNMDISVLSYDDSVKIIEATNIEDISVEIVSESNKNLIEMAIKSDKIDETEHTMESETSNKVTLNETENVCSPMNRVQEKSEGNFLTTDDNELTKLMLDEQNACQDENKSLDNSMKIAEHSCHSDSPIDVEALSLEANDESPVIDERSSVTQIDAKDDLLDSTERTEKDSSKYATKSTESSEGLETVDSMSSDSNTDNTTIRSRRSSNVAEAPQKSTIDVTLEKAESKDASATRRESTDLLSLETEEKKSPQLEENSEKNSENTEIEDSNSDIDVANLFQDIPAAEWKERVDKKDNEETEEVSVHSNVRLAEKQGNESESECDLVLVDKKAWLAAENIKAAKEKECFDYDSDDTVLLKSRSDALKARKAKRMEIISEITAPADDDSEEEEAEERVKTRKSLSGRRSASKKNKDNSSGELAENENNSNFADKSLDKSKDSALNRSGNRSASRLNESGQATKAGKRSSRMHDESDEEEIEDDTDTLNRSSRVSKKNTSLRGSTERRRSLIKSSKDTPTEQSDQSVQNRSRTNDSGEEINADTDVKAEIMKKGKRSLNRSQMLNENIDDDIIEAESTESPSRKDCGESNASLNRSADKKSKSTDTEVASTQLKVDNSDESNESEVVIRTMDLGLLCSKRNKKNHSMIAHTGSTSNDLDDSLTDDSSVTSLENQISRFLSSCDNEDNDNDSDSSSDYDLNSIDSDVKKEYNLSGAEQKFPDDDIPGDECRASETESSDPDDNGSDLVDFLDDDDEEVGDEEEKKSDEKEQAEEKSDEEEQEKEKSDEEEQAEEKSDEEEQEEEHERNVEKGQIAENEAIDEAEENERDVAKDRSAVKQKVESEEDEQMKNVEQVPHIIQTKRKGDVKKRSHAKENETILLDDSILTSSTERRRKSNVRDSFKDTTEQDSIKLLNEFGVTSKRKAEKQLHASIECSTPKLSFSEKKFEQIDIETHVETLTLETEDELNDTNETTKRTSLKGKKSRKDSVSKEDIGLNKSERVGNTEKELLRGITNSSKLTKAIKRLSSSQPLSLMTDVCNKTLNITHTETPTIRHLRKEKLNESAPELILKEMPSQSKEENNDIARTEVKEKKDREEKIQNLVKPSSNDDEDVQKSDKRKRKKRKKRAEEATSNEDIFNKVLPPRDTIELSDISEKKKKKKKRIKLSAPTADQATAAENNVDEDVRKTKKRKRQIHVTGKDKDINEGDTSREDICKNEMESAQRSKKKKAKIEPNLEHYNVNSDEYTIVQEKDKRRKEVEDKEVLPEKSSEKKKKKNKEEQSSKKKKKNKEEQSLDKKKKNKEEQSSEKKQKNKEEQLLEKKKKKNEEKQTSATRTKVSKSKRMIGKDATGELCLQNIIVSNPKTVEPKNVAFAKARNEALEAIKHVTDRMNLKEKERKRKDAEMKIQKLDTKASTKQQKREKARQVLPSPSTSGLKRLPDDVIENLSDVPMRARKKRKISRNEEQFVPSWTTDSTSKFVESTVKSDDFVSLSSGGSTTHFALVNLQKVKKQSTAAASFRESMLKKNKRRQPVSSYLMYLQKQQATSSDGFSTNPF